MYVAAYLEDEIKEQVLKECESRTYEIGKKDKYIYLLTPLSFDPEQQSLNETWNLTASSVIKGCEYVYSLLQYSDNSIMVCGEYKAIVVDADTMDQLKTINIKYLPCVSSHVIPGTDFKFFLEFNDSQFVRLCNVETGQR